jgi:hypothetical protein
MAENLTDLIFEEAVTLDKVLKREIKKSIVIKKCTEFTHVFVLAVHPVKNKLTSISYKEKSSSIGGYAYDSKFGKYYVDCVGFINLGVIPISFSIRIDKVNRWECRIPLAAAFIIKYLNEDQRHILKNFKKKNRGCKFEFLQLISCYNFI